MSCHTCGCPDIDAAFHKGEDRADARCIMTAATLQFESLRSLGKIDMNRQIEEMEDCIGDAVMALRAAQRAIREEERDG